MDYRFYVAQVGKCPDATFARLKALLPELTYGSNASFKDRPNFDSYRVDVTTPAVPVHAEFAAVIDEVKTCLEPIYGSRLAAYEVNRLKPGGVLGEHTDLYGPSASEWRICLTHKVHLPLLTDQSCMFTFRRAKTQPQDLVRLAAQYFYAYNNYVWHSAKNIGEIDRYELTLIYDDPDWSAKARLYKHLNLTGDGY